MKEFFSRLDTIMEKLSGLNANTIQVIQIGALNGMKMKKEKKVGAQSLQRYSNAMMSNFLAYMKLESQE